LAWDASVENPENKEVWRKGGFRDKELAIKAAKYAVRKALGAGGSPQPITVYNREGQIVGEVGNAAGGEDAKLRIHYVELAEAMESYEEPEDLFAFLRRKGFTLEG